ncbi:DUF736 family protein [Caulobacter sp. Root1472]|uniref:DUF736 family protein n=1 Tax=Caulobacter sp. Root1472 TaxID=1736470 RepID=UPI0009E6D397|nr:DUF736 family protein [Caulobacter sp. Root1472]
MAIIGTFTANANGTFSGSIRSLSLNVRTVQFRPVDKTSPKGPDFRVYSGAAGEAALFRRLDRMSRQLDRLERDVTIANEAIGLYVKTWLKVTPAMSGVEDRAAAAKGQERYAAFIDLLARRISEGRLLRAEVLEDVGIDRG